MFADLPNINSIKVFEAAARLESFKAAADELHVTPTAVSHQIRGLEEKLDTLLFQRRTRSVTLTREGELLAQAAFRSLQLISLAVDKIAGQKTILRVSTTTSFAALWLVPRLMRFQQKFPDQKIEIKTGEKLDLIEKDRSVDLAIRYGQFDAAITAGQKLVTEKFMVYGTKEYLSAHKDLKGANFIETRWQNRELPMITGQQWLNRYRPDTELGTIKYFDQELHVLQAVLAGQGVALLSSVLAQEAEAQNWLIPYDTNCFLPGLTYYGLKSPFSQSSKKTNLFLDWLVAELS